MMTYYTAKKVNVLFHVRSLGDQVIDINKKKRNSYPKNTERNAREKGRLNQAPEELTLKRNNTSNTFFTATTETENNHDSDEKAKKSVRPKSAVPLPRTTSNIKPNRPKSAVASNRMTKQLSIKNNSPSKPSKPNPNTIHNITTNTSNNNSNNNNITTNSFSKATDPRDPQNRKKVLQDIQKDPLRNRRSRMKIIKPEEPYWDNNTCCGDRDEFTRELDNNISKQRDIRSTELPPKYEVISKDKKERTSRNRAPTRTSGAILNLKLAKDMWNPPKYQIHPDNVPGFEGYKFGTDKFSEDTTARPHTGDKSSSSIRKLFNMISPDDGIIRVSRELSSCGGSYEKKIHYPNFSKKSCESLYNTM
mmetsp:Transcript_35248/g.35908  ORF Transcript_35248/g.35908 Transcript_35248/m.35908 type:complete len:362 (+) Transcript_35248:209-1294(+)